MNRAHIEMLQPRRLMAVVTRGRIGDAVYEVTDRDKLIVTLFKPSVLTIVTKSNGNGMTPTIYVGPAGQNTAPASKQVSGIKSIQIFGSMGDDRVTLAGPSRDTTAFLGGGDDYFQASTEMLGSYEVHGGDGDDELRGDIVFASGKNVRGSMRFYGDAGDDRLSTNYADDLLVGGAGNDRLKSFAGRDTLEGGDGKDTLDGGTGIDKMNGGASIDRIEYRSNDKLSKDKRDHLTLLI